MARGRREEEGVAELAPLSSELSMGCTHSVSLVVTPPLVVGFGQNKSAARMSKGISPCDAHR